MPEAAVSTSKPSSATSSTSSSSKAPLAPPPKFDPSSIKIPSTPTLPPSAKAKIDLKNLPKPPPLPTKASARPPAPTASNTDSNAEKKPIDTSSIAANKHVPISQSSNASKKKAKEFATHSLKEDIPTLDSAPSSIHGEMTAQTNLDDEEPTIPHHPRRNILFTKQPPHHLLTYAQRSIPILVLPTDEAKAISEKNNLSLTDMLNGMANSIMREMTTSSSGNGGGNNMPSLGKLPPIRSVNRMIHLKWDMISLQFVEKFGYPNDDSSSKEKDVEWEERLKYASELWSDEETVSSLEDTIESLLHSKPMEKDYTTFDIDQDAKVEEDERRRHEKGFDLLSHFRTPWYARFRNGINQQTSHQPFSMMHCPPVVLYVASSAEGIDGLEDLLTENANLLPKEYKNGLFDPNGMREHFLIMHDEKDGPDNQQFQEVQVLQEMRNRFGPGCAAVVRVNSGEPSSNTKEDIIWDECVIPSTPKSHYEFTKEVHRIRGGFLSSQDKLSLRRFMSHMVTSVIIPAIEKRIYDLNVEVTNHKKGVKNLFKSFMRKPRDGSLSGSMHGGSSVRSVYSNPGTDGSISTGPNGVPYTYKSIESQTRLLADTLFLIRDYEGALSMYRLVKDDYKHDQNLLHNASVHEMMALSMYLTDLATGYRSTREIITHIETSLALYSNAAEEERRKSGGSRPQVAPIATRCVTRLCLLMSAVRMLCEHRDMETADNLASASSNETPLGAAILLEQSSGHYFRAGMIRKYAFHVLMAGHMFRSAGQEYHAVRCFASALHVYNCGDRFWPELFNHLMSALAGQLYGMKRMKSGLQLYAKLVGTTGGGRVSVRSQQKFLDHLVTICRAYEVDALESSVRIKSKHYGDNLNDWQEVEEVIMHTPNARRVLEILNMGLPHVDDLSIKVEVSCHIRNPSDNVKSPMMFGKNSDGSDEKWQDLTCHAEAELRIHQKHTNLSPKDFNRLVLDEVDEEKKKLQTQLRRMKKSKKPIERSTRAKLEPISVSFDLSNPLSILVPISSIQIIARLTCEKTHRVYTNVESIDIAGSDDHEKKQKKWKFAGSDKFFEIADFSRISPSTDTDTENWISGAADEIDPYFLVSKGRIAMEPRSTSTVSLELCPLVMGELEIIGIRCKIFNEIWVSQNFPSLDANLSAGVSSNLKSKIDCDMPNITVDIVRRDEDIGHNRVVLQGQVGKWVMRVANQGAAHATNLFLKTNVPWINICHDGDVTENAEVSNCIGPSGTMMQLPIQNASDNTKNTIAPGETIDIPIDIRTSGGGKQEFYMLFRYELFEKATSSKQKSLSPKVRWFKKMVSVPVYPSLTLTASLTPSFLNKKESILSVEVSSSLNRTC